MKALIFCVILVLCFCKCNHASKTEELQLDDMDATAEEIALSYIDSLDYVILEHDTAWYWVFGNKFKKAELTIEEIGKAEGILSDYV